jgi:hypothetical protein
MIRQACIVALFACSVVAQVRTGPPKVTAVPIEKVTVPKGGKAGVEMLFRVAPGFHINSNKPTSDLYIPTAVKFDVPTDISLGKVEYPEGELLSFPFDPDTKLSVYTGDITVKALVMTAKSTPKGTYRVHGNLRYQACDNRACYPPTKVPIAFDVTVANAKSSGHATRKSPQSPHIK